MAPAPRLPVSDHCDGRHFFNPGANPQHGFRQVLRWRLEATRAAWPPQPPGANYPPPPAPVESGVISVTFIGHATFLLRLGGLTILTDPMFSERCSPLSWIGPRRARPPGIALRDLPRIDLVVVSHNHYDHLDLPSLRHLQTRDAPAVVTMLGNRRIIARAGLHRVEELDWWERTEIGSVAITATPALHFSARTPFDRNRALWGGFMFEAGGRCLLFAGDSGAGPHWRAIRERLGTPDVALLPIGAYEPRWLMAPVHMDPNEAMQAHLDLGARRSIGMHFGTFQLTDEAIDAPERALRDAASRAGLVAAFSTLGFGQTTNG